MPSPSELAVVGQPRPPRLRVRGLAKRFDAHVVLDGADLDVAPGEIAWLTGGNGSGKSTLLRCVAGLARHDGEITIDGEPVPVARRRGWLGYLPQTPGLPVWATPAEVLGLFARLRRVPGAPSRRAARPPGGGVMEPEMAIFLPPLHRPLGTLSGGQRQRVAVAVALLGEPRLVLLDEPAANLDEEGSETLARMLAAATERGASIVVAAPVAGAAAGGIATVADRAVRVVGGRVEPFVPPRSASAGQAGSPPEVVDGRSSPIVPPSPSGGPGPAGRCVPREVAR